MGAKLKLGVLFGDRLYKEDENLINFLYNMVTTAGGSDSAAAGGGGSGQGSGPGISNS